MENRPPKTLQLSEQLRAAIKLELAKPEYASLDQREAHLLAIETLKRTTPAAFQNCPGDHLAMRLAD